MADTECVDAIGGFTMTVEVAEASSAIDGGWTKRAEVLTAWLAAAWCRQQDQSDDVAIRTTDRN